MSGWPNVSFARYAALVIGCLAAGLAPGLVGARFQPGAWYEQLARSPLTPPGWVFPTVWTVLYLMIGIALFIVIIEGGRRLALVAFGMQAVLNAAWSWLFFGRHAVGAALVEIVVLWLAIVATIAVFARHSRAAAWILVPYLAWVSFATYLTFEVWRLN
jgi:benzodiazapine receptor